MQIFKRRIYQLKKGKRNTCSSYEVANLSEENLKHIEMKYVAREEKILTKRRLKIRTACIYIRREICQGSTVVLGDTNMLHISGIL